MTLTRESRAAIPAGRDWCETFYGQRHALSPSEVIDAIQRHYPGGWDQFLTDQSQENRA
jgi:hypothetical protein